MLITSIIYSNEENQPKHAEINPAMFDVLRHATNNHLDAAPDGWGRVAKSGENYPEHTLAIGRSSRVGIVYERRDGHWVSLEGRSGYEVDQYFIILGKTNIRAFQNVQYAEETERLK